MFFKKGTCCTYRIFTFFTIKFTYICELCLTLRTSSIFLWNGTPLCFVNLIFNIYVYQLYIHVDECEKCCSTKVEWSVAELTPYHVLDTLPWSIVKHLVQSIVKLLLYCRRSWKEMYTFKNSCFPLFPISMSYQSHQLLSLKLIMKGDPMIWKTKKGCNNRKLSDGLLINGTIASVICFVLPVFILFCGF